MPSRAAARQTSSRVADGVRCRELQQPARIGGERVHPLPVALLDAAGQRTARDFRSRRRAPPAPMPRGSSSSASGLPRVSATICSRTRSSSRPATTVASSALASSAEPAQAQLRQPAELAPRARFALDEHDRDGFGEQAAGDEPEHLRGGVVEPLQVVDDAQQRLLSATSASSVSVARPTRKRSGGAPAARPNATSQRLRCGGGSAPTRSSSGAHI